MSSRTCPDWPELMERAAELQFKHFTVAEAQLPAEVLMKFPEVPLGDISICCDLEHHVFYRDHTDERVAAALSESHWFSLDEWEQRGPGHGA